MSFIISDISEVLLQLGLEATCSERERAIAQTSMKLANAAVVRHLNYNPVQGTRIEFYPQMDFRRSGRAEIWEATDTQAYIRELSQAVTNELQVVHLPIRSIVALNVDYDGRFGKRANSFGAETLWIEGTDFWAQYEKQDSEGNPVCSDGIIRCEGRWPDTPGSVRVEYVAGYTDAELHGQDSTIDASPILDAVLDESERRALKVFSRMKKALAGFSGPLTSESMGDYSYQRDASALERLIGGGMDLLPETVHKLQEFVRYDLGAI